MAALGVARATADELTDAVEQLSSDRFADREEGARRLWRAGPAATDLLEKAALSTDPEVAARAKEILELHRYGVMPDTPAQHVQQIDQFRHGSASVRQKVLEGLHAQGELELLVRLIRAVEPAAERDNLLASMEKRLITSLRKLMAEQRWERAESLLEMLSHTDSGRRHWIAFHLGRGSLETQIKNWMDKPESTPERAVTLALLTRAHQQPQQALAWARQANDPFLVDSLLIEQENWQQLSNADSLTVFPGSRGIYERLGFMALIHQWAGAIDKQQAVVEEAVTLAESTTGTEQFAAIEVLLANERVAQGLELLKKNNQIKAAYLLSGQHRHGEALKLLGVEPTAKGCEDRIQRTAQAIRQGGKDRNDLSVAIETAIIANSLGWKQTARKGLEELGEVATDSSLKYTLLRGMVRAGHKDLAFRYANSTRYTSTLFGTANSSHASMLGLMLKATGANRTQEQIWIRTDQLLTGKGDAPNWKALEDAAEARSRTTGNAWTALAKAAIVWDELELAEKFLRSAINKRHKSAHRELGDLLRQQQRWAEAAEIYQQGSAELTDATDVYLAGHCWIAAGDEAEGQRLCDLGLLLPLGDGHRTFGADLREREINQGARSGWEIDLRVLAPRSSEHANASLQLGDLVADDDPVLGGRMWRRQLLSIMKGNTTFTNTISYLRLPAMILRQRSRVAISEGKLDEAKAMLARCAALMPRRISVPEELTPVLDKAGHRDLADWLYEQYRKSMQTAVDEFPNSALYLNNLAWLSARCNRDLDQALEHSQRAVKLEPDSATYLDTLAEVRFRLGDREEAIRLMKQCIEMDGQEPHFRAQIKRFQGEGG